MGFYFFNIELKHYKEFLISGKLTLDIKDTADKIYVEVNLVTDKGNCSVIISGKHNRVVYIERLGKVLIVLRKEDTRSNKGAWELDLVFRKVYSNSAYSC